MRFRYTGESFVTVHGYYPTNREFHVHYKHIHIGNATIQYP